MIEIDKIKLGNKDIEVVINDRREISFKGKLGKESSFSWKGKSYEISDSFYDERDDLTYINIELPKGGSQSESSNGKSSQGAD
jgi:hypothetical protein